MSTMKRVQAYKFVMRPTKAQAESFAQAAGCRRYLFNRGLALQKERHAKGEKNLSYNELAGLLPSWKRDEATAWLAVAPSQALQHAFKDLDRAYANFFQKRGAAPTFKKKGERDSFRLPAGVKLDAGNARVFLPKTGWVRFRKSRDIEGELCNATVSLEAGAWFVSIQTEREVATPAAPAAVVGIDLGVKVFAALSSGEYIAPNAALPKLERSVKRAQKALSRKQRGSKNRAKARKRLADRQAKLARKRLDRLHKLSHEIAKNHGVIVMEDLAITRMTKSAAGTVDAPGTGVKAKSRLNRSILNQGWGEFRRQLEYKSAWNGGRVILVNPANTSRSCSCCGHVAEENRKTQADFKCVSCGHEENADANAAKNILAAGLAVIAGELANACGGAVGTPLKQEPASVSLAA